MRIEKRVWYSLQEPLNASKSRYELCNFETRIHVCQTVFGHRQLVNHLFSEKLHQELAHWGPVHWATAIIWFLLMDLNSANSSRPRTQLLTPGPWDRRNRWNRWMGSKCTAWRNLYGQQPALIDPHGSAKLCVCSPCLIGLPEQWIWAVPSNPTSYHLDYNPTRLKKKERKETTLQLMCRKMVNNEINADCKCNLQDAQSPVTPQRTNPIWLLLNVKCTCKK